MFSDIIEKFLDEIFLIYLDQRLNNKEVCKIYGYYINGSFDYKINYFVKNIHRMRAADVFYIGGPYFADRFLELIDELYQSEDSIC
jgi:hypothetical protein